MYHTTQKAKFFALSQCLYGKPGDLSAKVRMSRALSTLSHAHSNMKRKTYQGAKEGGVVDNEILTVTKGCYNPSLIVKGRR